MRHLWNITYQPQSIDGCKRITYQLPAANQLCYLIFHVEPPNDIKSRAPMIYQIMAIGTKCRKRHVYRNRSTCRALSSITFVQSELEIVDQWSTRIPPPHRRGWQWQWVDCNWTLFKITRQPFWKRHSWQSLGFCLQQQRTCTWNLKLKFHSKLELRCRNHAIQKPKNLIWPPGSHLENEVTENQ